MSMHYIVLQTLALGQAAAEETPHMTPSSWAYMLVVWGAITALNIFCFYRLFAHGKDVPHR